MSTQTLVELVQERPDVSWEAAPLLPLQGHWSETEYLWLANRTNKLVELARGNLDVLPMPSPKHQKIVLFLYRMLFRFVEAPALGLLLVAPLSVRLWPGQFREPDLVFMLAEHLDREAENYWNGADMAIEVVSPSNSDHDLDTKRKEYAQAGIAEYWIVNLENELIVVLQLDNDHYVERGQFKRGDAASSVLLAGFAVDVAAVFDAK